jgi:hypothetical protein
VHSPSPAPYAPPKARVDDIGPSSKPRRIVWFLLAVSGAIGALFFLTWAVQTAWLGSFPGRDVDFYSRWAYVQFALFVACTILSIFVTVRLFKRPS